MIYIGRIKHVRTEILLAWIACCTTGLTEFIISSPPCKRALCAAAKTGVLLKALKAAGFFPAPLKTAHMSRSVLDYWKSIKSIGAAHSNYNPCMKTSLHHSSSGRQSTCTYQSCFGDFGTIKAAEAVLERYTHVDLWQQWQKVCNIDSLVCTSLT
jgi:hypothetical protein